MAFSDPTSSSSANLAGDSNCAESCRQSLREKRTLNPPFGSPLSPFVRTTATPPVGAPPLRKRKIKNDPAHWRALSALNFFFRRAAQLSTLRSDRICYRSFTSIIGLYFSFCELGDIRSSPVPEIVAKWSALSKPGALIALARTFFETLAFALAILLTGSSRRW